MMLRRDLLLSICGILVEGCSKAAPADSQARARADLYQCEGCEGALERRPTTLAAHARIGGVGEAGTPLVVTGTVFMADGERPCPDVVIYAYHTNAAGLYAGGSPGTEASRRHGRLRGWVRTGSDGRYRFDTMKPVPYPDDIIPTHLHFTKLEPGKPPYWIDDIVFAGEFGVTSAYRRAMTNKGGNGIVRLSHGADGTLLAMRDILLERHPA